MRNSSESSLIADIKVNFPEKVYNLYEEVITMYSMSNIMYLIPVIGIRKRFHTTSDAIHTRDDIRSSSTERKI